MTRAEIDAVFESLRARLEAKRTPVSTYRLQFNHLFTFNDAAKLVQYLHDLGVTHVYASPYFKANPGSLHGYDISDHNSLNPEIGSRADYRRFVRELRKYDMGHVLDFVPNHMGIMNNPWWQDVLENGPSSPYAEFFDIDWYPVKSELLGKVLLPILEDQYGKVLEEGKLNLAFRDGAFAIIYGEHELPVGPETLVSILSPCLDSLVTDSDKDTPDNLEMQSIITACKNLPDRNYVGDLQTAERQREKQIIKRRLRLLYQGSESVRGCLDDTIRMLNGKPGETRSFDLLHELLENQAYRLSYWRVASDEINYRRFFDINHLVAIRMEDIKVFEATHRLLGDLLGEGMVDGLRIDHVDGLFNPAQYLRRLQSLHIDEVAWCETKRLFDPPEKERASWILEIRKRIDEEGDKSAFRSPLYVVVEKILGEKEALPRSWTVDGTSGYEFGRVLNGIFVNRRNGRTLRNTYQWFTRTTDAFTDIAYGSKNLIMEVSMSAELNVLAHQLDRVSEQSRVYRDFTLNSLRDAIKEVVACFPVYRTYVDAQSNAVGEQDRAIIYAAVADAERRNPAISSSLFDFLRDVLMLVYPADMSDQGRQQQQQFVMRFQQLTGPIMAKGVEDTAFYVYNRLASLNEVGSNPERFGNGVDDFHNSNFERLRRSPHSMVSTATHDSKRGEDMRVRLDVLSEIPGEWRAAVARWGRMNRTRKTDIGGEPAPDRNEEYLVYQTMLGTYPQDGLDGERQDRYVERIQSYMLKAIREAKVHTSWISPDAPYEKAILDFVAALLDPSSDDGTFLSDFSRVNKIVATCGVYNSLAQVALKTFVPGVPDIYQGTELWDFSLVDPDNRRPVDFAQRAGLLQKLKREEKTRGSGALARELMAGLEDGLIKMFVTWKCLTYRREKAAMLSEADYIPLKADGAKKGNVCAFARRLGSEQVLVVVPRLVARLTRNGAIAPIGQEAWGDTILSLPRQLSKKFRNIFTGETLVSKSNEAGHGLRLDEVMSTFPIAILVGVPD